MRRVLDVLDRPKRAGRAIKRWYDAVRRVVTKRSVLFPALGIAVFTAILLGVVTRQRAYELAALFVTVVAVLITRRVILGSKPEQKVTSADESSTEETITIDSVPPVHASARVQKLLHPDPQVEVFQWEDREHIISLIDVRPGWAWIKRALDSKWLWRLWMPGAITFIILAAAFAITSNVGLSIIFLLLIGIGYRLLEWHRRFLVITTRRYVAIRGVTTPRRLQVRLENMQDFRIEIPWHSTVLKTLHLIRARYGTLVISVAGDTNEELKSTPWFPRIEEVDSLLTHLTLTLKK